MLNTTTLINPRRLAMLTLSLLAAVLTFAISAGTASAKVQISSNSTDGMLVEADGAANDIGATTNFGPDGTYIVGSNVAFEFGPGCSQERAGNDSIAKCGRQGDRARFFLRGGNDTLSLGGSGANTSRFFDGARAAGGDGNDELFGELGQDRLNGEDGNDRIVGGQNEDRLIGGDGNDEIFANDGIADGIFCGAGEDSVSLDLKDPQVTDKTRQCENVIEKAVDEGPATRVSSRSRKLRRGRKVRVRLFCPRALTKDCEGKASLKLVKRGSRSPRKKSYDIEPGTSELVTLTINRREARRVRSRRRRAIVKAVEQGDHGPKTTIRRITVKP